jgi:hypothetical protein
MVNLSPDTETKGDWGAGYIYGNDTIRCFSHIHGWQLAGLPVMPTTSEAKFSHDDEVIRAGYHKVVLRPQGITAELTSTMRVGFHRYTFPDGVKAQVLFDLALPMMDFKILSHDAVAVGQNIEGNVTIGPTMRRPKPGDMMQGTNIAAALSPSPSINSFFFPIRADITPPGTLNTANAMNTKNDSNVAMTLLSWNCFFTASDSGPMASATPMTRNARKMGNVFSFSASPLVEVYFSVASGAGSMSANSWFSPPMAQQNA